MNGRQPHCPGRTAPPPSRPRPQRRTGTPWTCSAPTAASPRPSPSQTPPSASRNDHPAGRRRRPRRSSANRNGNSKTSAQPAPAQAPIGITATHSEAGAAADYAAAGGVKLHPMRRPSPNATPARGPADPISPALRLLSPLGAPQPRGSQTARSRAELGWVGFWAEDDGLLLVPVVYGAAAAPGSWRRWSSGEFGAGRRVPIPSSSLFRLFSSFPFLVSVTSLWVFFSALFLSS